MGRLEVLGPADLHGPAHEVMPRRSVVGRAPDVDWHLDDPMVSRHHAAVWRAGDHDAIEDLGSTAGTLVNGRPVHGPTVLRPGDVVDLATVRLRYVADERAQPPGGDPTTRGNVAFTVDDQRAGTISNVARDQYNSYVQHVIVERENALDQVASMNRYARMFVIPGQALAGLGVLSFIATVVLEMVKGADVDVRDSEAFRQSMQPIEVAGIPLFALAMGVALLGFALVLVGAVIQSSAKRTTERVEHDYPLPPYPGP
jgi:hypothetical protein